MSLAAGISFGRAKYIGRQLIDELEPACHRIEVKGSVSREVPRVHDLELVAIPKDEERSVEVRQGDLFAPTTLTEPVSLLWERLDDLILADRVMPLSPGPLLDAVDIEGRDDVVQVSPLNWAALDSRWRKKRLQGSRYFKLWLPKPELQVDLFMPKVETWGAIATIRTGSAQFSAALVTAWKRSGRPCERCQGVAPHGPHVDGCRRVEQGLVYDHPRMIPTLEERDFFEALGVAWVGPRDRRGRQDVRRATANTRRRQDAVG